MVHPIAEANEKSPFGNLTPTEFYARHSVSHSSEFITNSRGLKLFTQWWTPLLSSAPIGVICMAHGFACESSRAVQLTAVHFTKAGFIVCAIDYQGHGFSDGLKAHIPDVNSVVDDCIAFYDGFRERHAPPSVPSFLYGESLGGAIALLITLRRGRVDGPRLGFDGVVLSGAMCRISNKFTPPWPLPHLLGLLAALVPTWPVAFTRGRGSILERSFKVSFCRCQLI